MRSQSAHGSLNQPAASRGHSGYCPACFALIDADADTCPVCGRSLRRLSERSYRDKLLAALRHPLADVRMRAIIALGLRGESETAGALARCALRHPTDVMEGLEIIESLRDIGDPQARERALHLLATRHPARAVRSTAWRVLAFDMQPSSP